MARALWPLPNLLEGCEEMSKTTRRLTCIYRFRFDSHDTLSAEQGALKRQREPFRALASLLALGTALCLIASPLKTVDTAHAVSKPKIKTVYAIDYQIYALQKIRSIRQFDCLVTLWDRESNWRPKAKNGTHYGIPQGHSPSLRLSNGYHQVDWGIAYIRSRYGIDLAGRVNACAALAHSYAHWWY